MRTFLILLALFFAMMAVALPAIAAPPQTMNYQGVARDKDGKPLDGLFEFTFSLYNAPDAAEPLWRQVQRLKGTKGQFSAVLGGGDQPAPIELPFNTRYYLGVSINGDTEMQPRQPLDTAPYAFRAIEADSVPDGAITDRKIAGPISDTKIPALKDLQAKVTQLQDTITQQQSAIWRLLTRAAIVTPPWAEAGFDSYASSGTTVYFKGAVSEYDIFIPVSYSWSIDSAPAGNSVKLSSTTSISTSFAPVLPGTYVLRFSVNYGFSSATDTVSLQVSDGLLGVSSSISNSTYQAGFPAIATDGNGNGIVVWSQPGVAFEIWENRFTSSGWGVPQMLVSKPGEDALTPQVAMDSTGNTVLLWLQMDPVGTNVPTNYSLWGKRHSVAIGWSAPRKLSTESALVKEFFIANNPSGELMAIWSESLAGTASVVARHMTSTGDWGDSRSISAGNGPAYTRNMRVALNGGGVAVAVWEQHDGTRYNIWGNRYTPVSGWGTAVLLENNDADAAHKPAVAIDDEGKAMVAWYQSDGPVTFNRLWVNISDRFGIWGGARKLDGEDGHVYFPEIAGDGKGNFKLVWEQTGTTKYHVWTRAYSADTGWGAPELLERMDTDSSVMPKIAMNRSGSAVVAWLDSDHLVMGSRYIPESGWSSARSLENNNYQISDESIRVAVDNNGDSLAVWSTTGGTYAIWADRIRQ